MVWFHAGILWAPHIKLTDCNKEVSDTTTDSKWEPIAGRLNDLADSKVSMTVLKRLLTEKEKKSDSLVIGDVPGQSSQAPAGPDSTSLGAVLRWGSAAEPGQLQRAGEQPVHGTSAAGVVGRLGARGLVRRVPLSLDGGHLVTLSYRMSSSCDGM